MGDLSVLVDRSTYADTVAAIRQLTSDVRQFPALPIVVIDEGACDHARLRGITGVTGIEALTPDRSSILTGLDRAGLMLDGRPNPWIVGGVAPGETYPVVGGGPLGTAAPPAILAAINLSLGEHDDALLPTSPDDSVIHALAHLAQATVCVVAAGNGHAPSYRFETLSPWAESDAVLSVGATVDPDGTQVAPYSARESALRPGLGPDILAWGASELDHDVVGTSFAATRVSVLVALTRAWLLTLRANIDVMLGQPAGVPLVGVFMIDIGFMADGRPYTPPEPLMALPILGSATISPDDLVAVADRLTSATSSRSLLLAAARATSPTTTGASPSITPDRLTAWLDQATAASVVSALRDGAHGQPSSGQPLFPAGTAAALLTLVNATIPIWEFEVPTSTGRTRHDLLRFEHTEETP